VINDRHPPKRPILLLGTKSDLVVPDDIELPERPPQRYPPQAYQDLCPMVPSRQAVPTSVIEAYAAQHGMVYLTCSAKERINIERVFSTCVRMLWLHESKYGSNRPQPKPKPNQKCHIQ
jgi:GTPase SAR1 family protein